MSAAMSDASHLPNCGFAQSWWKWLGRLRRWIRTEIEEARYTYMRTRAVKGHARSQLRLGLIYESGRHGPQSDSEAYKWFLKAAYKGVAEAQARVGLYRCSGRGVAKDDTEAFTWLRKAA